MSEPLYPDVHVQLTGRDGNAGSIMGRVVEALRRAGAPAEDIARYRRESMSADYANLLRVAGEWVNIS